METPSSGRRALVAAALATLAAVGAALVLALRGFESDEGDELPGDPQAAAAATREAPARRETPRTVARGAVAKTAASEALPRGDGAIVVRVTSAQDGAPIEGATATVHAEHGGTTAATTGADGTARFERLELGEWMVDVTAPGRLPAITQQTTAADPPRTVEIALREGVQVAVEVTDARSGRPVAGARALFDSRTSPVRPEVETDARGRGTALLPPATGHLVWTSAPGHLEAVEYVRTAEAGAPQPTVRVALARAGTVRGVVLDPDGKPVEGADVVLTREDSRDHAAATESAEDGSYRIDGLALDRRYAASASHHRFAASAQTRGLAPTEDRPELTADLRLRRPGSLVVSVVDEEGGPVFAFRESLTAQSDGVTQWGRGMGNGRWESLDPGRYTVRVWMTGALGAGGETEISEGAEAKLELRLGKGGEISGVVVDVEGEPIETVRVSAAETVGSEREDQPMMYTRSDGTFEIGPFAKGLHDLRFDAKFEATEGFEPLVLRDVAAPSSGLKVVLQRRGRMRLRVVLEDPALSESTKVEIAGPRPAGTWSTGCPLRADGALDFGLPGDVAGDVMIRVPGFEPAFRRVVAAAGADLDLGDVHLRRGLSIEGVLRDADGDPVAQKELRVGTGPGERRIATDASGAFRIDGLSPGPLRIESPQGDHGAATVFRVGVPSADAVTLALPRGGVLSALLVERSGAPARFRDVVVRDADGVSLSLPRSGTDDGGWFETPLAPGAYTVEAEGFDPARAEVREGDLSFVRVIGR